MAFYSDDQREYHRERVREILALKPAASIITITNVLRKHPDEPLNLDRHYVSQLLKKIRGERIHRYDKAEVRATLAELQDTMRELDQQMWTIVLDPRASKAARTMAAGRIIESNYKFFDAQLNAGIFERNLGKVRLELEHERKNTPLPDDVREIMLAALKAQGLIKETPKHVNATTIEPKQITAAA